MQGVERTLLAAAAGIAQSSRKTEGNEVLTIRNGQKVRTVQVQTRLPVAPLHPGYQSLKVTFLKWDPMCRKKRLPFLVVLCYRFRG